MKKVLSLALMCAMLFSVSIPTFATDINLSGSSASVPVELTVDVAKFSVTVPTALPIDVAANGVVTTADDAKIINNSHGAVRVTNMAIEGVDAWEIVNWDSANMSAEKVGSTKVAMTINGDKTTDEGEITFTPSNFPKLDGVNDDDTDELAIIYDAKIPAQAMDMSGVVISSVVFTIGWDNESGNNNGGNGSNEPEKDLISFSFIETDESEPFNIDSAIYTTYYAEKDMTWGEWVDSDYNVNELQIGWDNCVVLIGGDNGGNYVFLTYSDGIFAIRDGDLIEEGIEYTFTDKL